MDGTRFGVSPEKAADLARRMDKLGIREEDLEEKFVRGSGSGGQKINKTSVAVQLRHGPSGTDIKAQLGRSQALNRFHARRMLCDKIEETIEGRKSKAQQRREKIRRQKRRRSRRAKEKMLKNKHKQSEKKNMRKSPSRDD